MPGDGIDRRSNGIPDWKPVGGDANVFLGDNAGVNKFNIYDSDGVLVGYIDSDGNMWLAGTQSQTPTDTPTLPPAGGLTGYYDTDFIWHVIDDAGNEVTYNFKEVFEGGYGGVMTFDEVYSMIQIELLSKTFDKNVLLRDGDSVSEIASSSKYMGVNPVSDGDVCLLIADITDYTSVIAFPQATATINFNFTHNITALGRDYQIATATVATAGFLGVIRAVCTANPFGGDFGVLNLTALGTLTASHVLALNGLATQNGWTFDSTLVAGTTRWDAIATWMATATPEALWAIVIPKHISGMDPAYADTMVNRGGNLAFNDENYLVRSAYADDTDKVYKGAYNSLLIDGTGFQVNNIIAFVLPASPSTEYAFGGTAIITASGIQIEVFESSAKPTVSNPSSGLISAITSGGAFDESFTTASDTKYILLAIKALSTTPTIGDGITNTQLNAGSTANTYEAPLDSGVEFGTRTANQFINGDGENGIQFWTVGNTANDELTHDGTDFILKVTVGGSVAFVDSDTFTETNGTLYFNLSDTALTNANLYAYVAEQMDIDPVGWTWDGANSRYTNLNKASAEFATYFEKLTRIRFGTVDVTLNDLIKFQEVQLVKGSYTLAEMQAKGYTSFDPILINSCPSSDGLTTVSDVIYSEGGKTYHSDTVKTVEGFRYGMDEVDDTALTSGLLVEGQKYLTKDFIAGDDFSNVADVVSGVVNTDGCIFIATGTTPTTWTNSSELNAFNIWENPAPSPRDISEFVIKGDLRQPHTPLQNHIIVGNLSLIKATHMIGTGAAIDDLTALVQTKAGLSDIPYIGRCKVVNTGDLAANSETYYSYSDMTNFPDFINKIAEIYKYSMDVGVNYVDFYPNGVVVSTGGSIVTAGTLLFDYVVGEMMDESNEVL